MTLKKLLKVGLVCVGVATAGLGYVVHKNYLTVETQVVTINEVIQKDGTYMLGTDQGTFRNEDSWMHFKFNSGDYIGVEKGVKYSLTSYGYRLKLPFSWGTFKNVLSVEKIVEKTAEENKTK